MGFSCWRGFGRNRLLGGALALLVGLAGCKDEGPKEAHPAASGASPKLPPGEKIASLDTWRAAYQLAKPHMIDQVDKQSVGSLLLLTWAMRRMRWSDVGVAEDETKFAIAQEHIVEERGKRLCATGSVMEFHVEKTGAGQVYSGFLGNQRELFYFLGVGHSGKVGEQSTARFCGIVTGKYDYPTRAGEVGHAVNLLGMFDVPENNPDIVSN